MSIILSLITGILFFFTIIGVFGFWFAIDGLVVAVVISIFIFAKRPEQGQL